MADTFRLTITDQGEALGVLEAKFSSHLEAGDLHDGMYAESDQEAFLKALGDIYDQADLETDDDDDFLFALMVLDSITLDPFGLNGRQYTYHFDVEPRV